MAAYLVTNGNFCRYERNQTSSKRPNGPRANITLHIVLSRGWDSNPRTTFVSLIKSQVHLATLLGL